MTESSSATDPVINVIEQDIPRRLGAAERSGRYGRPESLDAAAMDAVSARRRREFDAARVRLRDQAIRSDADAVRSPVTGRDADTRSDISETARVPLDQPPERVRKRYLRAGNQYFLKDAPYQLAFEDLGPYLVTEHNRPDVVESMVDMVAAKSWRRIRVSGHEAFRTEIWLQGTLLGIEVSGYEPKAADLARLADARQPGLVNRIEVQASLTASGAPAPGDDSSARTQQGASAPEADLATTAASASRTSPPRAKDQTQPHPEMSQQSASDEPDGPRRYTGELREHGHAPYQNNPARSDSYYVVFRDTAGAHHVVWGVDLERAVCESGAESGQQISLENLGRRLVTVKVPILDAHGMVVGEEEKDVHRNTWQVDVVGLERLAHESATRAQPAFEGALVAGDSSARDDGRDHRRSTLSDEDKVLHLAVLVGAMRDQGFSPRSISRVQQRAEAMLEAFGRAGIAIPRPKIFDPKAPSGRDRKARPAAEHAPAREIDHAPVEPSPAR